MSHIRGILQSIVVVAVVATALAAYGEMSVSLTISGSPDELLPLLERLRDLGVGTTAPADNPDEPVRLEMRSFLSGGPARPDPMLALVNPVIAPSQPQAGETVMITIQVIDQVHKVDSVSASVPDAEIYADLYDNGTGGDAEPGDGVWTGMMRIPPTQAPGDYSLVFRAFDYDGAPVTVAQPGGDTDELSHRLGLQVVAR